MDGGTAPQDPVLQDTRNDIEPGLRVQSLEFRVLTLLFSRHSGHLSLKKVFCAGVAGAVAMLLHTVIRMCMQN